MRAWAPPYAEAPLQRRQSGTHQVISHMTRKVAGKNRSLATACLEDGLCRRHFITRTTPCQPLHRVAIAVTAGEVHGGVDACRILAQGRFDQARVLHEVAPVDRRQRTQASDRVADRHLLGSLLLRFDLHEVVDAAPRFRETLFHPTQRHRQGRPLALQPAYQLGDERGAHHR